MPTTGDRSPDTTEGSAGLARMGRGSGLNLVGALCYQAALFGVLAMLARRGEAEVGRYTLCYAVLALLSLLAMAGFRAGLTRFVATDLVDAQPGRLRGTLRVGVGLTALVSVLVAVALLALAPWVGALMDDPALVQGIRLVALTLPASTLTEVALSATQGWRTQRPFALVGRIGEPLLRVLLTAVLLGGGTGYLAALWAGAVSGWVAAAAAGWWLLVRVRRELGPGPVAAPVYRWREIVSFSTVSWVSALAATGLIWVDTLLLGALAGPEEVGTYGVATRLVMLAVFVMAPVNAAFTPHMAHLHHTGDLDGASRAYGSATRWILTLSVPAFVLLVVLPADLLAFFGLSYAEAAAVTVVLAVGQLASAAAGPCGTVLNMSGRVRLNMLDNLAALVLNVVLNLLLIPEHGVLGAAVAWSASLVLVNAAKLVQARTVVGVRNVDAGWGRVAVAAVPAVLAALAVRTWTDGWVPAVLVGGPAVLVSYAAALVAIGIPEDDRAILAAVRGGRGRGPRRRGRVSTPGR